MSTSLIWSRHALVPEREDVACISQRPEGRPSPSSCDRFGRATNIMACPPVIWLTFRHTLIIRSFSSRRARIEEEPFWPMLSATKS
jgi:hypothetical protein